MAYNNLSMLSVLYELAFGIFLFLAALILIPRLLSGDKKIYEIAVPTVVIFIAMILLTNNLNLSLIITAVLAGIVYFIRKKGMSL